MAREVAIEVIGEAEVATCFVVRRGRVARVARFEMLGRQEEDTGLTMADEQTCGS